MSATPRTDAQMAGSAYQSDYRYIPVEFARQLESELQEALKERDQLRQQLDIHAYEFKQLRDELECDGSDLPQLLEKIQLIRQQLAEAQAALDAIASWDEGPKVDSSFDEPGSAQIAREALTKLQTYLKNT